MSIYRYNGENGLGGRMATQRLWLVATVLVALVAFFIIAYRDVIWFPSVIVGADVLIPGNVLTYYLIGLVSNLFPEHTSV